MIAFVSPTEEITIVPIRETVTLPDQNMLMFSEILTCALSPLSLSPSNYTSRWTTPGPMSTTLTSIEQVSMDDSYIVNNGRITLQNGSNIPITLLVIQRLSYQDAGEYICEGQIDDTSAWVSATVQLRTNSKFECYGSGA